MQRLEVVGWWFNEQAPSGLPRPQLLVAPWPADQRDAVAAHLRAGRVLVTYPDASFCRFACGETDMGRADLTDGTYVWPEGLVHYVAQHDVRLPEPFVAHAMAHRAGLPPFRLPKPAFGLYDTGPWQRWARQQGACVDLAGWDVPTPDVVLRIAAELGDVDHEAILLCRGATRQVVLALRNGELAVHQLLADGHAPRRLAGWHEWSREAVAPAGAPARPPGKPGRGVPMDVFFASRRPPRGPQDPPE